MRTNRPVLLALSSTPARADLAERELRKRYGSDYEVVCRRSAGAALRALEAIRSRGGRVALLLADLRPAGTQFLDRAHGLQPAAKRVLLFEWGDRSAGPEVIRAWTRGGVDDWLTWPTRVGDEHFHQGVSAFLYDWARHHQPGVEAVQVVGERWSPRSHGIRDLLSRNSVQYAFHEPDSEHGRAVLARAGAAAGRLPLLVAIDGTVLADPSNAEIAAALGVPTRPGPDTYDVAVIGAGPAGLAAAVYAASEGLSTAVVEQEAIGGQAGSSSLIRNYLGFPRGVSGSELAVRAVQQAGMFGAAILYGRAVGLRLGGPEQAVVLDAGGELRCRSVVVASGVSYRRLGIPALEALTGAGVFYGAAASEARALAGERVYVVGGANSAGQAALHLARYAAAVTLVVRRATLTDTMSDYLVRQIATTANLTVLHGVEVTGGEGEGRLTAVVLRDRGSGDTRTVPAAALFVLIGAEPRTSWLPAAVRRDERGFVLTGPDLGAAPVGWSLPRAPMLFETSVPGVFAVGDVRHGSVKRVASSVGEGSVAIRMVHDHLADA